MIKRYLGFMFVMVAVIVILGIISSKDGGVYAINGRQEIVPLDSEITVVDSDTANSTDTYITEACTSDTDSNLSTDTVGNNNSSTYDSVSNPDTSSSDTSYDFPYDLPHQYLGKVGEVDIYYYCTSTEFLFVGSGTLLISPTHTLALPGWHYVSSFEENWIRLEKNECSILVIESDGGFTVG